MDKKSWSIIGIMLLAFWLSFIFLDWGLSMSSSGDAISLPHEEQKVLSYDIQNPVPSVQHFQMWDVSSLQTHSSASTQTSSVFSWFDSVLSGVQERQNLLQNIRILQKAYAASSDPKLLVSLLYHLASNYQFKEAYPYLQQLMTQPWYEKTIDLHVVIYILLHSRHVSLQDDSSIDALSSLVDQWRNAGYLSHTDHLFYDGLFSLWKQDFSSTNRSRSQIGDSRYSSLISSYHKAILDASGALHAPAYYQDALVALVMLKHGYFSLAKKISLSVLSQDTEYILPYQILAYANFLSNEREISAEYFLKLAHFDQSNANRYLFLVGASYYWDGSYEKALLYLRQVSDDSLLLDVSRYQLLSYLAMEDTDNAIRVWQKMLWQDGLNESDFLLFANMFFYSPYVNWRPFVLAHANSQLPAFYAESCARLLSAQHSACVYGDVWYHLFTATWTWLESKLSYLSTVYQQAPVFHVLGDVYVQQKKYSLAENAYKAALPLVDSVNQEVLIQANLSKLVGKR